MLHFKGLKKINSLGFLPISLNPMFLLNGSEIIIEHLSPINHSKTAAEPFGDAVGAKKASQSIATFLLFLLDDCVLSFHLVVFLVGHDDYQAFVLFLLLGSRSYILLLACVNSPYHWIDIGLHAHTRSNIHVILWSVWSHGHLCFFLVLLGTIDRR